MQFSKCILGILCFLLPIFTFAQSTLLPQQSRHLHFIDRMEIKTGIAGNLNFTVTKPYDRQYALSVVAAAVDSMMRLQPKLFGNDTALRLSKADHYNLKALYLDNQEWYKGDRAVLKSKRIPVRGLYQTPAAFYETYQDDYFVVINPLIHYRQLVGSGKAGRNLFLNRRGVSLRGGIHQAIGFSAMVLDVQERGPEFVQNWIDSTQAVPGANFYKTFKKTGVDYIDARGSFTFRVAKYIQFQAGYDRNFIGSGYRSLFLSDFGANQFFVKINTRIGKFNYQNLFMELHTTGKDNNTNELVPKKYAAMHHLSMNVLPWLNVGLFESVIFSRKDRFEFSYMNPVIFYRAVEGNLGSKDNAMLGLDFKANVFNRLQLYGQLLIDEFNLSKLKADSSGWWGNKIGSQIGLRYIDVAKIQNLDLQVEWNRVRPFTYSHFDAVSNYTHYNQPLAHPLGANFNEWIAIVQYQPTGKVQLTGKVFYWIQGLDSAGRNFGANIFRLNGNGRNREFGFPLAGGVKSKGINASFLLSYEWKHNLFLDASCQLRRWVSGSEPARTETLLGLGVRLNLWQRDYDF